MGVSAAIESMSEDEIRELLRSADQALEQLVATRARSTLKEAKRKPKSSQNTAIRRMTKRPGRAAAVPKWVQAALAGGETLSDLAIPVADVAA